MAGYLFVHFTGDHADGEQICFSLSRDGLHWEDLNGGQPVLRSGIGEKGVRDPFLIRDPKKGTYYLIATDLCIGAGKGWDTAQYRGSRDIIVWASEDLVHFRGPWNVTVGVEDAGCVWAPEAVYDRETERFFVFWASMVRRRDDAAPKQRIFAAYTEDFCSFSDPFIYMEAENHLIDMTIVEEDGWYYRFMKDETTKTIRLDRSRCLAGRDYENRYSEVLAGLYGVEGPECYRLDDGRWCLIVDQFAAQKGYLPIVCGSLEKGDFRILAPEEYDMGVSRKRHGGVVRLTDAEYERLRACDWR